MTDTNLPSQDILEEKKPGIEPAKRWRNWWRVICIDAIDTRAGNHWPPGDYRDETRAFPSCDLAETYAAQSLEGMTPHVRCGIEYLGALPDGERP